MCQLSCSASTLCSLAEVASPQPLSMTTSGRSLRSLMPSRLACATTVHIGVPCWAGRICPRHREGVCNEWLVLIGVLTTMDYAGDASRVVWWAGYTLFDFSTAYSRGLIFHCLRELPLFWVLFPVMPIRLCVTRCAVCVNCNTIDGNSNSIN